MVRIATLPKQKGTHAQALSTSQTQGWGFDLAAVLELCFDKDKGEGCSCVMDSLHDILKFFAAASFAVLTIIGALCQAFDGLSQWLTGFISKMTPRRPIVRASARLILVLWAYGAVLLAVDLWGGIRNENPLKNEALVLAKGIESDVKRGISPQNILTRYQSRIEAVIPQLLGSGDDPALDSLSRCMRTST